MATSKGHTSNGKGTLLIERRIAGIEIRRASGVYSSDDLTACIHVLEALAATGRRDLVEAVARGRQKAGHLLNLSRMGLAFPTTHIEPPPRNKAERLRDYRRALPLAAAIEEMIAGKKARVSHAKEMRRQLLAMAARHPGSTVDDLSGALITERETFLRARHLSAFTRLRANSMVLAKWADGNAHGALWTAVRDQTEPTPVAAAARRPHAPFTFIQFNSVRNLLNEAKPGFGEILVALCITGMRPSEYWGGVWARGFDYIKINGEKTLHSNRTIPLIAEVVPATSSFMYWGRVFRQALRDFFNEKKGDAMMFTPYDCRRTYAHWLQSAGLPRGRVAAYLGHAPADLTDFYARRKPLPEEITADGKLLARWIGLAAAAEMAAIEEEGSVLRSQTRAHTPLVIDFDAKP